jgi:hypothetical protein
LPPKAAAATGAAVDGLTPGAFDRAEGAPPRAQESELVRPLGSLCRYRLVDGVMAAAVVAGLGGSFDPTDPGAAMEPLGI